MALPEITPGTPVEALPGVGPVMAGALRRLGLASAADLVRHVPLRWEEDREESTLADLAAEGGPDSSAGVNATVRGEVVRARWAPGRHPRLEAMIEDGTGSIRVVWFNAPWLRSRIHPGRRGLLQGAVKRRSGYLEMTNPRWEPIEEGREPPSRAARLRPVYPANEELGSRQIEKLVALVLEPCLARIEDPLPTAYRDLRALPGLAESWRRMHRPGSMEDVAAARRRLAFDELFLLQLGVMMRRQQWRSQRRAMPLPCSEMLDARIRARLTHTLTEEQERVTAEIAADLRQATPMNRLLQGDVGSGKTLVAVYGMLLAVANAGQAALVAPTELLAEQHWRSILTMLDRSQVQVELLTGSIGAAARTGVLERIASGETNLVVGTHALLEEGVRFKSLALAVIDEQHRFGVEQRAALRAKAGSLVPHVLVMTATPIPRTLGMTLYGDLDVSVLRGRPPGRRPVTTRVVGAAKAPEVYAWVRTRLDRGEQAYVVVPAVEESDAGLLDVATHGRFLSEGPFRGLPLGMLHGRMDAEEREAVMARFRAGELRVLVATVVIEVGVDVPNASVMVVEHADRFGLSQLHQLRGRVGRGTARSYCIFIGDPSTPEATARLAAIAGCDDGFEIAETDLRIRGPGELFGSRQSGLAPFRVADPFRDAELLAMARRDARDWIERDPALAAPELALVRRKLMATHGAALGLGDVG